MSPFTYKRRYSLFAPTYTYGVYVGAAWIGEVARNEHGRKWWASNKTWTGGADLPDTYPTRQAAAEALRAITSP